jgi:hypothetical protein
MANEITHTSSLSFQKDGVSGNAMAVAGAQHNVSGYRYFRQIQSVTTSEAALQLGSLATLGWCIMKNLDATNFIQVRTATGGIAFLKLKAGETAVFRFGTGVTAPFIIADTATCKVEYMIVED